MDINLFITQLQLLSYLHFEQRGRLNSTGRFRLFSHLYLKHLLTTIKLLTLSTKRTDEYHWYSKTSLTFVLNICSQLFSY